MLRIILQQTGRPTIAKDLVMHVGTSLTFGLCRKLANSVANVLAGNVGNMSSDTIDIACFGITCQITRHPERNVRVGLVAGCCGVCHVRVALRVSNTAWATPASLSTAAPPSPAPKTQ